MDVVAAFFNGKLDKEIHMQQPERYVKLGEEHLVLYAGLKNHFMA